MVPFSPSRSATAHQKHSAQTSSDKAGGRIPGSPGLSLAVAAAIAFQSAAVSAQVPDDQSAILAYAAQREAAELPGLSALFATTAWIEQPASSAPDPAEFDRPALASDDGRSWVAPGPLMCHATAAVENLAAEVVLHAGRRIVRLELGSDIERFTIVVDIGIRESDGYRNLSLTSFEYLTRSFPLWRIPTWHIRLTRQTLEQQSFSERRYSQVMGAPVDLPATPSATYIQAAMRAIMPTHAILMPEEAADPGEHRPVIILDDNWLGAYGFYLTALDPRALLDSAFVSRPMLIDVTPEQLADLTGQNLEGRQIRLVTPPSPEQAAWDALIQEMKALLSTINPCA